MISSYTRSRQPVTTRGCSIPEISYPCSVQSFIRGKPRHLSSADGYYPNVTGSIIVQNGAPLVGGVIITPTTTT